MSGYEVRNYAQGDGLYTEQIQGGATVARYQLVYADATGRWVEADADAVATMPVLGLATQPLRLGQKGRVLIQGFANYNVWAWTPGGVLYADTVTGDLTQTPPAGATDIIQEVGVAFTATLIYFDGAGLGRSASGGTFLGDVDIFGTLTVDIINEHTLNVGVTIEGVILENGGITIPTLTATRVPFAGVGGLLEDDADMTFVTDTLTITNVDVTNTLTVDTINEHTADAGVTVEGVLMENSAFTINSENQVG